MTNVLGRWQYGIKSFDTEEECKKFEEKCNQFHPIIIHSEKGCYFNGVLYEGENAEQLAIKARNQYYNK